VVNTETDKHIPFMVKTASIYLLAVRIEKYQAIGRLCRRARTP
jgi:hypothetical protein